MKEIKAIQINEAITIPTQMSDIPDAWVDGTKEEDVVGKMIKQIYIKLKSKNLSQDSKKRNMIAGSYSSIFVNSVKEVFGLIDMTVNYAQAIKLTQQLSSLWDVKLKLTPVQIKSLISIIQPFVAKYGKTLIDKNEDDKSVSSTIASVKKDKELKPYTTDRVEKRYDNYEELLVLLMLYKIAINYKKPYKTVVELYMKGEVNEANSFDSRDGNIDNLDGIFASMNVSNLQTIIHPQYIEILIRWMAKVLTNKDKWDQFLNFVVSQYIIKNSIKNEFSVSDFGKQIFEILSMYFHGEK